MEQMDDGRDGLVVQRCHLAMAVKLTGPFLYPLRMSPVSLVICWQ
jgi:hypothetical protein